MGIDFGLVRVGVAVSDPLGILARGLETIYWNGQDTDQLYNRLIRLIHVEQVRGIIMGMPRRTDGKESDLSGHIRDLAEILKKETGIPVLLRDERYTTVIASRMLRERGLRSHEQKGILDQAAASILLQEYLDHCRKQDF